MKMFVVGNVLVDSAQGHARKMVLLATSKNERMFVYLKPNGRLIYERIG
ncbi:hypothetical protein [Listeria sp. SHR_NRA_18]|nr:hypothetical protein [Listeria sp. SHR_NRA_18]